jgi:hypothetical protein
MYEPVEVRAVAVLSPFMVRLEFTDGTVREIDLDPYLHGPIFQPLRDDQDLFRAAFVDNGTISWPNGADIDPDVLYLGLPPNASQAEWEAAIRSTAYAPPR